MLDTATYLTSHVPTPISHDARHKMMDMPADPIATLHTDDQKALIAAIEGAIEVREHADFHHWMRGPVRTLLPHGRVVCLELGRDGSVQHVESLDHAHPGRAVTQLIGDPVVEVALHLVRELDAAAPPTCNIDSHHLKALAQATRHPWPSEVSMPGSALIHRVTFLSGAAYHFVLLDIGANHHAKSSTRAEHLLKLLSSHLKMAWSKVIDLPMQLTAPSSRALESRTDAITARELDVLRLIQRGHSNQEISTALGISPITLKDHIRKIYRKLNVQNRSDALARCGDLLRSQ